MEEITGTPRILKSPIKGSQSVIYDENQKILKVYNTPSKDVWASLCTLLKNKPFEIRPLSLEDVQNYEQDAYESM